MGDKGDEMGEGMQCSDHPYRNNPGGICAFCLQEKLGKLVSSSKSNTSFPRPSSSSSSPSFISEGGTSALPPPPPPPLYPNHPHRAKIPFLVPHHKKKIMSSYSGEANLSLKRSKSLAVARHLASESDDSPRKKGFWSFLHLSTKRKNPNKSTNSNNKGLEERRDSCAEEIEESPNSSHGSSFGRKVARSRSVGCGSRSFSGDFLERISTGFGDCTLRRVESQREAKQHQPKIVLHRSDEGVRENVKCGGIFGMISSSSSSSSSLWLSDDLNRAGRISTPHSRSKSWGWAFASPMRAFRPSSSKPSYITASVAGEKDGGGGSRRIPTNSSPAAWLAVRG
ncbi:uncharacterized protein LOC143889701 [Tasmannia lanceolata]|uniref:uncharacterized protein LOC143889701 n=1 Tax=Tasmannia lanceolata TaxID=3420 RepID=UPI004062FC7F